MSEQLNNKESNTMPTPPVTSDTGYGEGETSTPKPETSTDENSNFDPYGYEKIPEVKPAVEEEKLPEVEPTKEEKLDDATGYDKPDEETKPADDSNGEKTPETLNKEEAEKTLGDLPEGYDKEAISKFVLDNKFTKEQTQAYVDLVKSDTANLKTQEAANLKATRAQWKQELKNDSKFGGVGGADFDQSVHSANKMFAEYLPNMKKTLTDRGGMLPPYIMKDLLAMHEKLNPKDGLVIGKPSVPEPKKESVLDIMYK